MTSDKRIPPPAEVFLCHSSKDESQVEMIYDTLQSHGVSAWWSKKDARTWWARDASRALRSCKVVLVICTESFFGNPDNVEGEIDTARRYKKPLIPLYSGKLPEFADGWEVMLGPYQAIEIGQRPVREWIIDLLKRLKESGVTVHARRAARGARLVHRDVGSPAPELFETIAWLDQLRPHADKLAEEAAQVKGDVAHLTKIEGKLPRIQRTYAALVRGHDEVDKNEHAALCKLQRALVEVAKALIKLHAEGRIMPDELPLPPYDLWLPFKLGRRERSIEMAARL